MVRTTYLKIRITPAEDQRLRDEAKEEGCTLAQHARRKLGLDNTVIPNSRLVAIKAAQAQKSADEPPASIRLPLFCVRCARIGIPSCPTCLKAAMG